VDELTAPWIPEPRVFVGGRTYARVVTTIKDSVHDHITVEGVARALLDTTPLQRLRHVRQLGTANLVYPSANHTRFEHALGVYHLADRALSELGIDGVNAETVRAAALLHDVGHGPFSHNTEVLIERHTGHAHDDVDDLVHSGRVGDTLRDHDIDPDRVAGLIAGEGRYGQLVSGEIDVDRADYLVRDAHHTGVPYGTIDHERLIRSLRFLDGQLVLEEGNVQTAESLLLARALMNPTVYNHHVARIGKSMLRRGTERLLSDPAADVDGTALRRMDDHDLTVALRRSERAGAFADRLFRRDLYKRAVWAERPDVPDDLLTVDRHTRDDLAATVAERAGVDREDVILDVPPEPTMRESAASVVVNGEIRRLDRHSPLVDALQTAQTNQWRLGVYAPAGATEAVGRAAVEELELAITGDPVSDRPDRHSTLTDFVEHE
jgi:HD superfamily phosphohydrolase